MNTQTNKIKPSYALWVASWYPSKNNPFPGDFIQRHALAACAFFPVVVLHVSECENSKGEIIIKEYDNRLCEVNVYLCKSNFFGRLKFYKFIRFLFAYWKGYRKIILKYSTPSIIHCHVIYVAGIFCILLKIFTNIPLIVSEHWSGYFERSGRYKGIFMKWLARKVTKYSRYIITISHALQDAMKKHNLHGNYMIIPNAVCLNNIHIKELKNAKRKKFTFIHVSSLDDDSKNVTGILKAIKKLMEERHDFILEVVGGMPDSRTEYFKKVSLHLGINEFVVFKGAMSHEGTIERMRQADAKIIFSNYEGGLPCVLTEAFTIGLPVIATKLSGLEEWVDADMGMIIEVGNIKMLAEAMSYMIDNVNKFNVVNMRNKMRTHCSYEVVGNMFYKMYMDVLSDNSRIIHS